MSGALGPLAEAKLDDAVRAVWNQPEGSPQTSRLEYGRRRDDSRYSGQPWEVDGANRRFASYAARRSTTTGMPSDGASVTLRRTTRT